MDITGTAVGVRFGAFTQSASGAAGAFSYELINTSAGSCTGGGTDTRNYGWTFKASNKWTGNTSENGGDTSKPATVAIMWILRFI